MRYPALIHKESGSHYGISFPDFPGCVSAGETVEEAVAEGREALALHCEGLAKLPSPTAPEELDAGDALVVVLIDHAAERHEPADV